MIESINPVGLDPAQAASASPAADPKASMHEVRDFAASLNKAQGASQPEAVAGTDAVQPAAKSSDGIRTVLTAFDGLNGGADSIREAANRLSAGGPEFSMSAVMQLTLECQQFMFQSQLTSNVANRTSDGIQQLFRQQS